MALYKCIKENIQNTNTDAISHLLIFTTIMFHIIPQIPTLESGILGK